MGVIDIHKINKIIKLIDITIEGTDFVIEQLNNRVPIDNTVKMRDDIFNCINSIKLIEKFTEGIQLEEYFLNLQKVNELIMIKYIEESSDDLVSIYDSTLKEQLLILKNTLLKYTDEHISDNNICSYSQYHEDLFIDIILNCKKDGFYVDIGANNPNIISNTKRFYKRGWHGINIEPGIVNYKKLCEFRKEDINLNVGIGEENSELTFYELAADTLSTFDKAEAINNEKVYNSKIINERIVSVFKLEYVLDKCCNEQVIDFMSIDAEGYELNILKSNNWDKYRPKALIIEINRNGNEILDYVTNKGYTLVFNNGTNGIFLSKY